MTSEINSFQLLYRTLQINFEKVFSPAKMFLGHIFMWLFLLVLLFLNYKIELELSSNASLLLALRGTVNNITVFYAFFYLAVPNAFKHRTASYFFILLCLPAVVYLWLATNYFQFKLFYFLGIEINDGPLKGIINKNAQQPLSKSLSIKNVLGNAMLVIYSFSPAFFLKVVFDIFKMFNKILLLQKKSNDLKVENINIEKNFLKAQLNPHFLFNTLNNLYSLVVRNDPAAPDVIVNISDIMAYTLYESSVEKVPLEKELSFLENFFHLEKMRYGTGKEINLKVDLYQDIGQLSISPLLTFPFMENGFKYGLDYTESSFLEVDIKVKENIFFFSIVNSKIVNDNVSKNYGGIGIENVKKRLQLIYPNDNHRLIIKDEVDFFSVNLTIKLL